MTRREIYGVGLFTFLIASAFTLASIIIPRWISWNSKTPAGEHIHYTYGLHRRCSSLTNNCIDFPEPIDCSHDRYFCSMWRSVGFLMSFAVVMEGMTVIAYAVIMAGGKQKRVGGWKILAGFHVLVGVLLGTAMSIIAYLYEHDDRFFPGWRLDSSWILCTAAFGIVMLLAAGLSATAFLLPAEAGYELIPTYHDEEE